MKAREEDEIREIIRNIAEDKELFLPD